MGVPCNRIAFDRSNSSVGGGHQHNGTEEATKRRRLRLLTRIRIHILVLSVSFALPLQFFGPVFALTEIHAL